MCGITGKINFTSEDFDPQKLDLAIDSLYERGPDDRGHWLEENVFLGHRRLSILDLSPQGHQPMFSHDRRYVIVHNGEIYNFQELKKILQSSSGPWQSETDTEVILAAFIKWGPDCLKYFHGMFAFAIWDRKEKKLFAARDRLGVKPFYYCQTDSFFSFASRMKTIFLLSDSLEKKIDPQSLRYYYESGFIPSPLSIFQKINKLPPAHFLICQNNQINIQRYWDLSQIEPIGAWQKRSENDLLDELDEALGKSVAYRMVSDVPLGAFLSGGIDSSLIVALMKKKSHGVVKTFTVGFDEAKYDESIFARQVSRHLQTEHHEERIQAKKLLNHLPLFLRQFEEPFFDFAAFPTLSLSQMTSQQVKVSLSGDGGDELFGGYHYYQIIQKMNSFFSLPFNFRKKIASLLERMPNHKIKLLAHALKEKNIIDAYAFSRGILKDFSAIIHPDFLGSTSSIRKLYGSYNETFPNILKIAEQAMRLDTLLILPEDYLQKIDTCSMAFSLEAREPMLDHSLVEWACKLPLGWKIKNGQNKYLLRKLAYRYLPEKMINRPKMGFVVPIDLWLRRELKDWGSGLLQEGEIIEKIHLNQANLISLWNLHQSGKRNTHTILWAVFILINFCKEKNI